MGETERELREMVRSCLAGSRDARLRFQGLFGEFVYNYPMKVFHLSKDKAGDFYIYVFENDRVFKRLAGFEARNGAHFRTYLGGFVLRDLFLEWQRAQKEPDIVSFETIVVGADSGEEGITLQEVIGDPTGATETLVNGQMETSPLRDFLASLDVEKRIMLKLLHLAEFDLSPQEIRSLCQKSGRAYKEVFTMIEEVRIGLRRKDERFAAIQDQLESIFGWILIYQKELAKISETLKSVTPGSSKHADLHRQQEELGRKLEWRYRQREKLLEKARQFRVTTPYKDIARLLNVPLGTVCSLVARVRLELIEAVSRSETGKQAAVL